MRGQGLEMFANGKNGKITQDNMHLIVIMTMNYNVKLIPLLQLHFQNTKSFNHEKDSSIAVSLHADQFIGFYPKDYT